MLKEGLQATEAEIINYSKERLAGYKRPYFVDFIAMSEMPLMGSGYKVLKRKLRDRYRRDYEKKKKEKIDRWGAFDRLHTCFPLVLDYPAS